VSPFIAASGEPVASITAVTSLSVSASVSAAVADGVLYTWGPCPHTVSAPHAILGRNCSSGQLAPTQVPGLGFVTAVSVGASHVLVVSDGALYGFGVCVSAALGPACLPLAESPNVTLILSPVRIALPVAAPYVVSLVAAAASHSVAVVGKCTLGVVVVMLRSWHC
jgi:hypothetical protein